MNESENARVREYLAAVRRGLRGLPRADVDDTIDEMRTHIFEEIGERGDAEGVLVDFGDAAVVASEIVERRLRPEDEPPVPTAPMGVRYSAWATDVVIGFGPLLLVPTLLSFPFVYGGLFGTEPVAPIWVLLAGVVLRAWVMSPAEAAQTGAIVIPAWQWALLVVLAAWAAYYWLVLRRRDSASVGMWMTGLRAVRVDDARVVVRARDISQQRLPLGAGKNRWWILLAAIPTGCLCILLALYYVSFLVGSFLQPWDNWAQPFVERQDFERQDELVNDFADALTRDDPAALAALVDGVDTAVLNDLLAADPSDGFAYTAGSQDSQGRYIVAEYDNASGTDTRRDIYVTVEKTEAISGHDYTESYRIVDVTVSPQPLPVDASVAD